MEEVVGSSKRVVRAGDVFVGSISTDVSACKSALFRILASSRLREEAGGDTGEVLESYKTSALREEMSQYMAAKVAERCISYSNYLRAFAQW